MRIQQKMMAKLPKFIPPFCKYHLKVLPNWLKLKIVSSTLNHFFKSALEGGDLDFLEDQAFLIDVTDLDYSVKTTLQNAPLVVFHDSQIDAESTLRSTFNPLNQMIS